MNNSCRICLSQDHLRSIFNEEETVMLSAKIMSIANVKIYPNDGLPNYICADCLATLDICMNFVQLCENTDLELRELVQHQNSNETKYKKENIAKRKDDIKPMFEDEKPAELTYKSKNMRLNKCSKKRKSVKPKYQCVTCGKVLASRYRLQSHMRIHTGERPYSCTHCGKLFRLLDILKVHMRTHTGEKPHHCLDCGASFAHRATLAAHERKHTGEQPYKCHMCPRKFVSTAAYQYHIRLHTGEKNYECDICSRAFTARSDLTRHILTHTGQKPHVCSICGIGVSRSSHLKRHMKTVHKDAKLVKKCKSTLRKKDYLKPQEVEKSNELSET